MTDETGSSSGTTGGLRLTPHQRLHVVAGRRMIQPPTEADAEIVAANARMKTHTAQGIPFDVRMALQALRDLAEQGNPVARRLYEIEAEKWGLRDGPLLVDA